MTKPLQDSSADRRQVHANGTDIHYVEAGQGPPLILLHGGTMSTDPLWQGHPAAYVSYLDAFAARFRVIAPDTRGHGRTGSPRPGPISFAQLAEDVLALVAALGLDRPLLCGFSDGGTIATIAALRSPRPVRALVNDAGFDLLNPQSQSFALTRVVFGGSPEATQPNPDAAASFLRAHGMGELLSRMQSDHTAQGAGGWKSMLATGFERWTVPSGVSFEDLRGLSAPTLILTGDRDMCCSVEEAVAAFRALPHGELAILPGLPHGLSDAAIRATLDFLQRHAA